MRSIVLLVALGGTAAADPRVQPTGPDSSLVYVEALGKAGAYGVGYEQPITARLAVGVEGSYAPLRDQVIATLVPYLHVEPLRRGHNALFGELGLELAHSRLASSVERWMGESTNAVGGVASVGYQRTVGKLVVRGALSVLAGKGGMAPWAGLAIGWRP